VKDGNGDVVGRVPSEAGDEQAPLDPLKSTENFEQAPNSGGLGVDSSCGKGNLDRRPSTTNMTGDKEREKEKKKSLRPDQEPFETWEREEMEKLLGELRGHLGERCPLPISPCVTALLIPNQSYIRHDSWKERTLRTISCSMRTGLCRSRFTTNFLSHPLIIVHA